MGWCTRMVTWALLAATLVLLVLATYQLIDGWREVDSSPESVEEAKDHY